MDFKENIFKLVQAFLSENPHLFLIDIKINSNNNIKVIIDSDTNILLKECVMLNKYIENHLNDDEQNYSLEVTSSGIGSPLLFHRQYKKNEGKELEVEKRDGTIYKGILINLSDNSFYLKWKEKLSPKRKVMEKQKEFFFEEVKQSKLIIKI